MDIQDNLKNILKIIMTSRKKNYLFLSLSALFRRLSNFLLEIGGKLFF